MLEDKMKEETPEEVFFKYSADCAYDLLNLKLISEEDYRSIQLHREKGTALDRNYLQKLFPNAISRIEKLARSLGRGLWDSYVIRKYFLEEHNKVIDNREGLYRNATPQVIRLCKVRVGKVINKKMVGRYVSYEVDYGDKVEQVIGKYLPDANVGDKISTHWRVAIEKI